MRIFQVFQTALLAISSVCLAPSCEDGVSYQPSKLTISLDVSDVIAPTLNISVLSNNDIAHKVRFICLDLEDPVAKPLVAGSVAENKATILEYIDKNAIEIQSIPLQVSLGGVKNFHSYLIAAVGYDNQGVRVTEVVDKLVYAEYILSGALSTITRDNTPVTKEDGLYTWSLTLTPNQMASTYLSRTFKKSEVGIGSKYEDESVLWKEMIAEHEATLGSSLSNPSIVVDSYHLPGDFVTYATSFDEKGAAGKLMKIAYTIKSVVPAPPSGEAFFNGCVYNQTTGKYNVRYKLMYISSKGVPMKDFIATFSKDKLTPTDLVANSEWQPLNKGVAYKEVEVDDDGKYFVSHLTRNEENTSLTYIVYPTFETGITHGTIPSKVTSISINRLDKVAEEAKTSYDISVNFNDAKKIYFGILTYTGRSNQVDEYNKGALTLEKLIEDGFIKEATIGDEKTWNFTGTLVNPTRAVNYKAAVLTEDLDGNLSSMTTCKTLVMHILK